MVFSVAVRRRPALIASCNALLRPRHFRRRDARRPALPLPRSARRARPGGSEVVRRLIDALRQMRSEGLIDSAAFDEQETIPEQTIRALAARRASRAHHSGRVRRLGLSSTGYARVFGEVSRLDPSLAVLIGVHCGLGSKAIALFGSPEQKQRYLPMLARGETLAAYALTEPDIGSDAQNIKTSARLSDDGSHWILNGRKQWIGNGHRAGVIATFAQTPTERHGEQVQRPTAFIIRPDMQGFHVAGTVRKLGIRGSTQAELHYDDLHVPADHVLGTVGKGFAVAVHVLNGGRLTLAAGCTAGSKEILGEMAKFTENRVQFGKPIVEFEITQRKLARIASDDLRGRRDARRAREPRVERRERIGRSRPRAARCSRARCSGARPTRWCSSAADAGS